MNNMKNYETILFDLYGTLVDIHTDEGMKSLWRKTAEFYKDMGAEYSAGELKEEYFRLVTLHEKEMSVGASDPHEAHPEIELSEVFRELYINRGVKEVPDELIFETALVFRKASTTHIKLYAGVRELLQALRKAGKRVILLSNAQRIFTVPELKELGIYDRFDDIFISSDHGCKKPDKRFFMKPVHKYSLDPADCLMIGNDGVCDIKGAINSGMDAYYIHSALSPKPCPAADQLGIPEERFQNSMDIRELGRRILR